MTKYKQTIKLYGDDFSLQQIEKWYEEEKEAYAVVNSVRVSDKYGYHELNKLHGFNKIKLKHFNKVLGFGAAKGLEFMPIIKNIGELVIIEPSDKLRSKKIGTLTPRYFKPNSNGRLFFANNSFDLVTCFGVLHHIPNVSFLIKELIRVLNPGGYLLVREPINSMGDLNSARKGLTKNERGIPISFFDKVFTDKCLEVISKKYCLTLHWRLQNIFGKALGKYIYTTKSYVLLDKLISYLLKWNVKYNIVTKFRRIAPSSIFYVIKKVKEIRDEH